MSNGYDRFVRRAANGQLYFTDATGACRGVIVAGTDCGKSGYAINSMGHTLVGEVYPFYTDNDG